MNRKVRRSGILVGLALIAVVGMTLETNAVESASSLPGGASSLSETYKGWQVACAQQGTAKRCVMSQIQTQQNGQRILAIELNAVNGNVVSGTLVLPFGLALDSGVTLQIDDKPVTRTRAEPSCSIVV